MIIVDNIFKYFGKLEVLKGVSCKIEKGEKVVIIGPSGSGKSTLLRCMNLLEFPTYGEVWMEGQLLTPVDPYLHFDIIEKSNTYRALWEAAEDRSDPEALRGEIIGKIKKEDLLKKHEGKEYRLAMKDLYRSSSVDINVARRKMGMVFQHFNLFNNLTVLQNMTLAPVQLKLKTKEEAEKKAEELLKRIGLYEKKDEYPSKLSGGQKQRIAIAGVLAIKPKIMILDESTAMLDPKGRREVMDVVKRLNKEENMTVILITHFMDEALEADRAIVMNQGEIVMQGTPEEIFRRSDELEIYNLALPRAAAIAKKLSAGGMPVATAFDAETVAEEICESLRRI